MFERFKKKKKQPEEELDINFEKKPSVEERINEAFEKANAEQEELRRQTAEMEKVLTNATERREENHKRYDEMMTSNMRETLEYMDKLNKRHNINTNKRKVSETAISDLNNSLTNFTTSSSLLHAKPEDFNVVYQNLNDSIKFINEYAEVLKQLTKESDEIIHSKVKEITSKYQKEVITIPELAKKIDRINEGLDTLRRANTGNEYHQKLRTMLNQWKQDFDHSFNEAYGFWIEIRRRVIMYSCNENSKIYEKYQKKINEDHINLLLEYANKQKRHNETELSEMLNETPEKSNNNDSIGPKKH